MIVQRQMEVNPKGPQRGVISALKAVHQREVKYYSRERYIPVILTKPQQFDVGHGQEEIRV